MTRSKTLLFAHLLAFAAVMIPTSAAAYQFMSACGPRWEQLPVSYRVNGDYLRGSGQPLAGQDALIRQIFIDSFGAWEAPCCSKFETAYRGETSEDASYDASGIVLDFEENTWDPRYGNVETTIGVTLVQTYPSTCTYANAPILFNAYNFTFTDGPQGTDLQSVATHEIGHLLGLTHTSVTNATMYAGYVGGTASRSLHADDINGVCALYNRSCSCTYDSDCENGEACVNQRCEDIPCQSDQNCEAGLECDLSTGECRVPPCNSDQECGSGFICLDSACRADCAVCSPCNTDIDCAVDSGQAFCIQGRCTVPCVQGSLCPGDSECWPVQDGSGAVSYLCGAPEAGQTGVLCGESYECRSGDSVPTDACTTNDECPAGQECVVTANGRRCVRSATGPCEGVVCPSGQICSNGACVSDGTSSGGTGETNNGGSGGTGGGTTDGGGSVGGGGGTGGGGTGTGGSGYFPIEETPSGGGEDGICSTTPAAPAPSGLAWLGLALGAVVLRRRRRR